MRDRRPLIVGFALVLAVGLIGLLVAGLTTRSNQVQTLGVDPVYPVAPLRPGDVVCQEPVGLAESFDRVRFTAGNYSRTPTPAMRVEVRATSGRLLAQGDVAAGWEDDGTSQNVPVGRVASDQFVSICIRNRGPRRTNVWGDIYSGQFGTGPLGVRPTNSTSLARVNNVSIPGDLSLSLRVDQPRSLIAKGPAMFEHASRFRPAWVGRGLYWLLFAAILLAAPVVLLQALARALREPDPGAAPELPPEVPAETPESPARTRLPA